MVDDLVELFLRPGGGVLSAQVIQHQQADVADLFEAGFKGGFGAVVGIPQPIQQVRDSEEKRGHTEPDHEVRHRRCQVGLPAAIAPGEQQPAGEVLGILAGLVEGQFERMSPGFHRDPACRGC